MDRSLRLLAPTLLAIAGLSAADTSYLVPAQGGVIVKPFVTTGDAYNTTPSGTKVFAGIPDGMGAFDNGDGTFTLLVNHEIGNTLGVARAHGGIGAFVSKLVVNKSSLAVTSLADLITTVYTAIRTGGAPTWAVTPNVAFHRFCSADLAKESAFYNAGSGLGVPAATARLFLNGEEKAGGRALMHIASGALSGNTVELPHLGRFAYENCLACPTAQDKTVVVVDDDTSPGFVGVYIGTKTALPGSPTPVDVATAAGLTNGLLYVVKANGLALEDRSTLVGAIKGTAVPFSLVALGSAGDVSTSAWADTTASGASAPLRTDATAKGTQMLRPEDGCWDPTTPGVFYFVTTDRIDDFKDGLSGTTTDGALPAAGAAAVPQVGRSRLWKLVFSDIANPQNGGTITCLIDGSENPGPQMLDNLSADGHGRLLLCEDPGGTADFAARLWAYDLASGKLTVVAKHDPADFGDLGRGSPAVGGGLIAPSAPFNRDEESSGVIDAEAILGAGWWLITTQNHSAAAATAETVEGGQLQAIYVPTAFPTGATLQSGRIATVAGVAVRDSGYGSAAAFVPGTTDQVWLLTDRGPNIDGAAAGSKLFPIPDFNPRLGRFKINGDGTADLQQIVTLKRADGTPLTGLPLPVGATGATGELGYALNADGSAGTTLLTDAEGIDSEGLVAVPDGSFWISDEYGPFLLHAAADGKTIERINATVANSRGHKLPAVVARRLANKGMEGLTMTPDGTRLVGMMQAALVNGVASGDFVDADSATTPALRIVVYTLATGQSKEYVYLLDDPATYGGAVSEITAISNTQFLVDERDGKFLSQGSSKIKRVYRIDISGATDIHDPADAVTGKLFAGGTKTLEMLTKATTTAAATTALAAESVTPVTKTLAVDLRLEPYKSQYNHDKIEGMALRGSTLWLANDDDFGVTGTSALGVKNVDKTTTSTHANGEQDFSQLLAIDLSATGVVAANNAPWISPVADQAVSGGAALTVPVTIGDQETPADSLVFTASSDTPALLSTTVGGSGSARTVTVTRVGGAGAATITLAVSDGTTTTTRAFPVATSGVGGGSITTGSEIPTNGSGDSSGCGLGSGFAALFGLLGLIGLQGLVRRR